MSEPDLNIASPTDAAEFRVLAESVLGRDWIQRLARALDINLRTAQRWASAGRVISPRAWDYLREQQAILDASRFEDNVVAAVRASAEAGASHHVLAGRLREYADQLHDGTLP